MSWRGSVADQLTFENPNSVSLADLCLLIMQLLSLNTGKLLEQTVPANNKVSLKVTVLDWPELPPIHEGNRLSLSGKLTLQLAGTEPKSAITVNHSVFDIDEFF